MKDPAHRNGIGYRFYHFSDVNAAIRRDIWEAVRFPEDLKVFEDLGIAKQILDRGWKIVYEPEAAVFHSHPHTTVGLFKRYFDIGYTLKGFENLGCSGNQEFACCGTAGSCSKENSRASAISSTRQFGRTWHSTGHCQISWTVSRIE